MKSLHESLDVKWKSHDFGKTTLFTDSGLCNFIIMGVIRPRKPLNLDRFDFAKAVSESMAAMSRRMTGDNESEKK